MKLFQIDNIFFNFTERKLNNSILPAFFLSFNYSVKSSILYVMSAPFLHAFIYREMAERNGHAN